MCKKQECYITEIGYWKDKINKRFCRNIFVPTPLSNPYLQFNYGNKGIFINAYSYNNFNLDESYLYGDLYLDFDNKEDFEKVREDVICSLAYLKTVFKIDYNDIEVYYSGNKGIHIMVPAEVLGIEPNKELNLIFKSIAKKISSYTTNKTLDMQIYDNKRMFRVPGSIHEDTGLYKIKITVEEVRSEKYNDILTRASSPIHITKSTYMLNAFANKQFQWFIQNYKQILDIGVIKNNKTNNLKYTPPCIEYILENGANDGNRNNTVAALASFYKSTGIDSDECIENILEWNSEKSVDLDPREITATIHSIFRKDKAFGCHRLKEISVCDITKCALKGGNN